MNQKEYPINNEMYEVISKALAAKRVRDLAIRLPGGYQKAKKAVHEHEKLKVQFWNMVRNVWPELDGKNLAYFHDARCVRIKEEKKDK